MFEQIPKNLKKNKLEFIPKSNNGGTRPLLLSSRLMALVDRCVNSRLMPVLNLDNRFDRSFAFRQNRGVEECIAGIVDLTTRWRAAKYRVSLLQLDLASAFSAVNPILCTIRLHELLKGVQKLDSYGWIFNYLSDWFKNRIVLFEFTRFRIKHGLPQCSPISPTLFNISVTSDALASDTVDVDSSVVIQYADD